RVAVCQALGDEAEILAESDDVIALTQRLSPEDCQLFYQIGIIGRRDLSLAPDPQSGFEMVLLRMLAFRPEQAEPESGSALGREKMTTVQNVLPIKKTALETTPRVMDTKATDSQDVTTEGSPPHESAHARFDFAGDEQAQPDTAQVGELDWNEMVSKLELHGLVRELARNAALKAYSGNLVELLLAPEHENLSGDRLVQSLENALKEQFNSEVKVRLFVEGQRELDTPSKRMSKAEEARQFKAEQNIEADPTIQSLQNQFGATIEDVGPK
ncbi:MAG: DNA polymerase III subunit gamma/tau C-terminal domain-containing protein, partial [Gammaproteobacteria bacterium]